MSATPQIDPHDLPEPCDHEWEFIDNSFDHEFGTERVHSWQCEKCGESRTKCPVDYNADQLP